MNNTEHHNNSYKGYKNTNLVTIADGLSFWL